MSADSPTPVNFLPKFNRRLLIACLCLTIFWLALPGSVRITKAAAPSHRVVVFLVNGFSNCCTYQETTLIDKLEGLTIDGVDIVFAGLDARNLTPDEYENYAIPWNSLKNRHEGTFDVGGNIANGTNNFIAEVQEYMYAQPAGTAFIFIGHSFGGDSVLSLLQQEHRQDILFAGVIDPVDGGGIRATEKSKTIPTNVNYFYNRWQTNVPWPIDFLLNGSISCSAPECNQKEQSTQRNSDGSAIKVQCGELEVGCSGAEVRWEQQCVLGVCTDVPVYYPGEKNKPVSHSSLATDAYVQQQMFDIIRTQLLLYSEILSVDYASNIYIDNNFTGLGIGIEARPFKTIAQAINVAEDGATLIIQAGTTYAESFEIHTPMTLRATGGTVIIDGRLAASSANSENVTMSQSLHLPLINQYDFSHPSVDVSESKAVDATILEDGALPLSHPLYLPLVGAK